MSMRKLSPGCRKPVVACPPCCSSRARRCCKLAQLRSVAQNGGFKIVHAVKA